MTDCTYLVSVLLRNREVSGCVLRNREVSGCFIYYIPPLFVHRVAMTSQRKYCCYIYTLDRSLIRKFLNTIWHADINTLFVIILVYFYLKGFFLSYFSCIFGCNGIMKTMYIDFCIIFYYEIIHT